MASLLRTLVVLACCQAIYGVRVTHDLADHLPEVSTWSFQGTPHMICGGSTIWGLISGYSADAENIQWGKIEAYQKSYLESQRQEKTLIEGKLAELQKKLDKAIADEKLPETGTEHHKMLIAAGAEVFGGIEEAHEFRCGRPGVQNKEGEKMAIRQPMKVGEEAFRKKSAEFFSKKEFRLDAAKFLQYCGEVLVKGITSRRESYCPTFCQHMTNIANDDSYEAVGQVAVISDKIKAEMKDLQKQLTGIIKDIDQCNLDSASLSSFKDQLADLKGKYETCNDIWFAAEEGLEDALYSLSDLEKQVGEATEAAELGEKLLQENKGLAKDAQTSLDDMIAKEKDLLDQVTSLTLDLKELSADLMAALTATDLIDVLKKKVVTTMFRMSEFFDAGVREPIRNIGFTEDPDDFEFPKVDALDSARVLKEALTSMSTYCEQTAIPAFAETKEQVPGLDLDPLCGFDTVDNMFTDLTDQVKDRESQIKEEIMKVVSWLNPWKSFTDLPMQDGRKKEEQLVEGGQLMYLEQVKSFYQYPTNKFFPYLIDWRKDGPHHLLASKLATALGYMEARQKEMKTTLLGLTPALAKAKRATATAKKNLDDAMKQEAASSEDLAGLKEMVEELEEKQMSLKDSIDEWKKKVADALKAVELARERLDDAFFQGIANSSL